MINRPTINWIIFSGIWIYPFSFIVLNMVRYGLRKVISFGRQVSLPVDMVLFLLPLVPVIILFIVNSWLLITNQKTDFSFRGYWKRTETMSREKRKYLHHPVVSRYLSRDPEGLILGTQKGKYVRIPYDTNNVLHTCIIGTSGSGKSSGPLICSLLSNFMKPSPEATMFVLDIKPELAAKTVELYENPYVRIINPTDQNSYGWNVYYYLNDCPSEDELMETFTIIANALIFGDRTSPRLFVDTARNLFIGFMIYHFYTGFSFTEAIREVLNQDIQDHIISILNDETICPKESNLYAILNPYKDIAGNAFDNAKMYLQTPLKVFLQQELKYMFDSNPRKASPLDLEQQISIFLSFPEASLAKYQGIFNLMVSQTLYYLQRRSEYAGHIIHVIIDEFARIGRLDILQSLGTLRSRKVAITLALQDLSQLRIAYSPDEAASIFNLCEVICILACHDPETCKVITDWAGTYREPMVSYSHEFGRIASRQQTSYQYRRVIDMADLMTLRSKRELIVFIEGQYYRFKKIFYKDDPVLGKRYREIAATNGIIEYSD